MRLGLFENREKLVKHEVPKMKFAIWGRSTSYFQTRPNPCISQYEVPLNCHEIQMISSCLDDFPTLSPQKNISSWWFGTCILLSIQLGMSSSQLTIRQSFFRGVTNNHQPDIWLYTTILVVIFVFDKFYWRLNHHWYYILSCIVPLTDDFSREALRIKSSTRDLSWWCCTCCNARSGVSINRWFLRENPNRKWIIWRYPNFRKPPYELNSIYVGLIEW